jgi:hypothetical protein
MCVGANRCVVQLQARAWRKPRNSGMNAGAITSGQIPTLSIYSAEHRRNRRKQKENKLTQG